MADLFSLRFGAKIQGCVAFSVPAIDVTAGVDLAAPPVQPASDLLACGSLPPVPALVPGALAEIVAHPGVKRGSTSLRHRSLRVLGVDQETGLALCEVGTPSERACVLLDPSTVIVPGALASMRESTSRFTYKFNGENWLVEAADGNLVFYRRFDRRPLEVVTTLSKNIANLAAHNVPLFVAAVRAAAAGDDAIVSFVGEWMDESDKKPAVADALERAASGDAAAVATVRALPFTTRPFKSSVFWRHSKRGRSKAPKAPSNAIVNDTWRLLGEAVDALPSAADVEAALVAPSSPLELPRVPPICHILASPVDFKPAPAGWIASERVPDPASAHWPGYVPIAHLRTGGEAPGVWVPIPATSLSGDPRPHWEAIPAPDAPAASDAAPSFLMPLEEAQALKVIKASPLPAHCVDGLRWFGGEGFEFYRRWLPTAGSQWSFEAVGTKFQGNMEALEQPLVLVPHGWFPGDNPAVAALQAELQALEDGGTLPVALHAYLLCQALFAADPDGKVVKEGLVIHGGSSWKCRRDDFGFPLGDSLSAHGVFSVADFTPIPEA